jgi:hypothetical protein
MGEVTSTAERVIDAPATTVRAALADYAEVRPQILTPEFSDYRLESGGQGAGTRAHWKLAATKKRVRDCLVEVAESTDGSIVERDANSSIPGRASDTAYLVASRCPPAVLAAANAAVTPCGPGPALIGVTPLYFDSPVQTTLRS